MSARERCAWFAGLEAGLALGSLVVVYGVNWWVGSLLFLYFSLRSLWSVTNLGGDV